MLFLNISHDQALDLELKLNVSVFGKKWSKLGDFLYDSRLDPNLYKIDNFEYQVTNEQFEWIKENIKLTKLDKSYKLFI